MVAMKMLIIIDTSLTQEKFSLINFTKSQEIWWLFVQPFKSYNSLKSARAQCVPPPPPPPRQNRVHWNRCIKCTLVNYELLVNNDIHLNQREDPSRPALLEVDRKMSLLLLRDFVASYLSAQMFFNLKTSKQTKKRHRPLRRRLRLCDTCS